MPANRATSTPEPVGITVGPDRLYFAEYAAGKIGSLSYTGSFGEVSIPDPASGVGQLAEGVDGNIFFDEASGANLGRYSAIAPGSGSITEWNDFLVTTTDTAHLVSDPNGVIWFAEYSNNSVVRMTTWGSILSRTALSAGSKPWDLTIGADSASVWVTEQGGNKIAKFNAPGWALDIPVDRLAQVLRAVAGKRDALGALGAAASVRARTDWTWDSSAAMPAARARAAMG